MTKHQPRREPEHTRNTRIDADSYAEEAMQNIARAVGALSPRRRGYVRDEIADAFEEGEHQGLCRALRILSIAQRKATSPEIRAALAEVSQLLAPDVAELPRSEGE